MFRKFKMSLIISIAIILVLSVSNFFINRTIDKGKIEAILKVKSAIGGYSNYPDRTGKVKGVIRGGGPSPGIQIPGEFETKVGIKFIGVYQVTFTEYWDSKDFKYKGSKDGIQSHFITFEVKGNQVYGIKHGGDFSPRQVK